MPSLFCVHILAVFAAVLREWLQIERGEGVMHEAVKVVKPRAGEGERGRELREGRGRDQFEGKTQKFVESEERVREGIAKMRGNRGGVRRNEV